MPLKIKVWKSYRVILFCFSATGDVRIHEVSPDGRSVCLINMSSNKVNTIERRHSKFQAQNLNWMVI